MYAFSQLTFIEYHVSVNTLCTEWACSVEEDTLLLSLQEVTIYQERGQVKQKITLLCHNFKIGEIRHSVL